MEQIEKALSEVKDLHQKIVGSPAPKIGPEAGVPFPPGVDPVSYALEEVEELKSWIASQQAELSSSQVARTPQADLFQTGTGIAVLIDLPGLDHEDLSVCVEGDELIVRGERKAPQGGDYLRPFTLERSWGAFERRFPLPPGSGQPRVAARYMRGVLEVRAERSAEQASAGFSVEIE